MPITVASEIRVFPESDFHSLAEKIVGVAFGVHNDFGRLIHEDAYKQAIARRCVLTGITPSEREVEIRVSHGDFSKPYFMDLLFAHGLMLEAKTVEKLNQKHRAQAIHYLLLTGMHHGLLLNLRPGKVEKEFVSSHLGLSRRCHYEVSDSEWKAINEPSLRLREIFLELLDDWGAFLQTSLYRDAIVHFLGGKEAVICRIPIFDGTEEVGTHETCLIANDTALAITSLKEGTPAMQSHLQRFLAHTHLRHLQWINMNNHQIEFRTLNH